MKFTEWTLILGALGIALKDEVRTLMISSELSVNSEVVTLMCNNQRISAQVENSAIGCHRRDQRK